MSDNTRQPRGIKPPSLPCRVAICCATLLALNSSAKETSATHRPAPPALTPYTASYTATRSGLPLDGEAVRSLVSNPDGSWTLSFKAKVLVYEMSESSHFKMARGQIIPQDYLQEKDVLGHTKRTTIHFNWGKKTANSRNNGDHWTVNLKPADLDPISYQQQLQRDVDNNVPTLSYQVIKREAKKNYRFRIDGREQLNTPVGVLETIRLVRVRSNNKRQTTIWLAKNWHGLLVQLQQTEGDKNYLITLKQATVDNKTVAGAKPKPLPL